MNKIRNADEGRCASGGRAGAVRDTREQRTEHNDKSFSVGVRTQMISFCRTALLARLSCAVVSQSGTAETDGLKIPSNLM